VLSRLRTLLTLQDPGRRALRRGTRVAVVVPVTLVVAQSIPWVSQGALMAAFASLALMVFSDFGGPLRQRFAAYLVATIAGVPLLVLGAYAGQARWSSVVAMFAVALTIGVLAVLRGLVTAAQSVLLLATVLSLTTSSPAVVWPDVTGWLLGGLAAALSSVLLWPARPDQPIPGYIADALEAEAQACDVRYTRLGGPDDLQAAQERVNATVATLHANYDGDLLRPAGVTGSDRALAELVDEVSRLRNLQGWQDPSEQRDPAWHEMTARLCSAATGSLRRCAERLRGTGAGSLSSARLFEIRGQNLDEAAAWVHAHRGSDDPVHLRQQIEDTFPARITMLVAARITDQTIAVAGKRGDQPADPSLGPAFAPAIPDSPMQRVRMHLSWSSPWFRNAVRSAVALSLSVALAKSVSLAHPFWIVLGTLSALRFDALGTGRTARQALVGTTAGVALSALCIAVIGDHTTVWWLLFPIGLFWAAYTPGTLSYIAGQAGFSFVVIVMFSILTAPRLDTAEARLVDVALGLAISLIVSLLMWPRGVVETLYERLRAAMTAACDFYVAATDWMAGGAIDDRLLNDFGQASAASLARALEALDLSIAQRPPKAVALQHWTTLANTVNHVDFAARLMPQTQQMVAMRGDQRPIPPPMVGPLLTAANDVRRQLMSVTEQWCELRPEFVAGSGAASFHDDRPAFTATPTVSQLRAAIDDYLAQPDDWQGSGCDPRPVVVTRLADWTALFSGSAQLLRVRA